MDADADFDAWIDAEVRDADVFVWVVNGEATVTTRERDVVAGLKSKVERPNIVTVVNRYV